MPKLIIKILFPIIIICSFYDPLYAEADVENETDTLMLLQEKITDILFLGKKSLELKNYKDAKCYFEEGLELVKKSNLPTILKQEKVIGFEYFIGKSLYKEYKYDTTLLMLKKLLKKTKPNSFNNDTLDISIKNLLSDTYRNLGDIQNAYKFQLQVKEYWETVEHHLNVGDAIYKIVYLFCLQENHPETIKYSLKCIKSYNKVKGEGLEKAKQGIYRCYSVLMNAYNSLERFELALDYGKKALKIAEEMNYMEGLAYANQNIGGIYFGMGYCNEAIPYMEKSLIIHRSQNNEAGMYSSLSALGNAYTLNGQFDKALESLNLSLELAHKLNTKQFLKRTYEFLSTFYEETKDWEKAYEYHQKYIAIKDELLNETMLAEMGELRDQHEIQKKERENEILLLKKKREAEKAMNKKNQQIANIQRNTLIAAAFGSLLFMSLIALMLYYRYKNESRVNEILTTTNRRIQLQNAKLITSNQDLEQFAYIASHDLKEPLRTVGGFTTLLQRRFRNVEDEDTQEYMDFIVKAVHQMQLLLSDLLNYSKIGQQDNHYVQNDLNDIISTVLKYFQGAIKASQATITVEKLPPLMASQTQMVQLFQNVIGNALKFKKEDVSLQIHIGCREDDDNYIFWVKDNGIGIEKDYLEKVFVAFKRLHHRGKYEGTGIGLATCKKIIEHHEGQIWVQSTIDEGSTFYFSIPKELSNKEEEIEDTKKNRILPQQLLSGSRKYSNIHN